MFYKIIINNNFSQRKFNKRNRYSTPLPKKVHVNIAWVL